MKLLMLSPYPLFPLSAGGKIRPIKLAREFSRLGIDVTVAAPWAPWQRRDLYHSEPFNFRPIYYPLAVPYLLADRPFPYRFLASFHPGLRQLLPAGFEQYDIYHFEHVEFARLAASLPADKPVVYDAQNVEIEYVANEYRSRFLRPAVLGRIERLERMLLARADHVFCCSERDRIQFLRRYGLPAEKSTVIANGVSPVAGEPRALAELRRAHPALSRFSRLAIFAGSNVRHNRDAVHFLLELAPQLPQIGFFICGSCIEAFSGAPGNVAFDPDLGWCERLAGNPLTALAPLTGGAGTSMKVLQYLHCGYRVLGTDFAFRGLEQFAGLSDRIATANRGNFAARLAAIAAELPSDGSTNPPAANGLPADYYWRRQAQIAAERYRQLLAAGAGVLPRAGEVTFEELADAG